MSFVIYSHEFRRQTMSMHSPALSPSEGASPFPLPRGEQTRSEKEEAAVEITRKRKQEKRAAKIAACAARREVERRPWQAH